MLYLLLMNVGWCPDLGSVNSNPGHRQMKVLTFWHSGYDLWSTLLVSFQFPGFCVWHVYPASHVTSLASGLWWQLWCLLWLWCQRWFLGGKNCQNTCFVHTIYLKRAEPHRQVLTLGMLWVLWVWWRVWSVLVRTVLWVLASVCHLWHSYRGSAPSLSYLLDCHKSVFMGFKPEELSWSLFWV